MGIRFECPNGHKLNVKTYLAGKRGICPDCGAKFVIPATHNGHMAAEPLAAAVREASAATSVNGHQSAAPQVPVTQPAADAPPPSVAEALLREVSHGAEAVGPALVPPRSDVWYVRPQSGGQFGPATDEVLKAWIAEGRLTEHSLLWREGWPEWKVAREAADVLPMPLAPAHSLAEPAPAAALQPPAAVEPPPVFAESAVQPAVEVPVDIGPAEVKASHRLAHRRHSERSRLTLAVALLIAVIVLGGLLIWVLVRSPIQAASERRTEPTQLVQSLGEGYVASLGHPT
jgi:GYF domain 2